MAYSQALGRGTCVAPPIRMYVNLDQEQAQVLREMLQNTLTQLRIETARTDSHDFRVMLKHREDVVASLISALSPEQRSQIS